MRLLLLVSVLALLFSISCKDKEILNPPGFNSVQASQDYLNAENIFNDIYCCMDWTVYWSQDRREEAIILSRFAISPYWSGLVIIIYL